MLHLPRSETGIRTDPRTATDRAGTTFDAKLAAGFRALESDICDCAMMAKIAETIMSDTDERQYPDELIFAVMHVSNMIQDLKKAYYATYGSEP